MHQKQSKNENDELNLSGEPPIIEVDESAEPERPAAAPASKRASQAAASRSRARQKSRSSSSGNSKNPYRTRSAAAIRAERESRKKRSITEMSDDPRDQRRAAAIVAALPMEKVLQLLHNPTRFVTEKELSVEYNYVIADLRSMGLLSLGLVVLLFVMAQVLPR